ncbi:hypothetical protein KSF_012790 [Reticulibacter mediterranei]|uniref:Uncharacterized protein n=1 Tax=Reticulibacter mediterranei TaxID=2778369 RepID=A0A8J3IJC6_9CHLR|nr:hypothetical protein [Reticulibacter mediterranei]GHO91231.1 hypothetical protein KSF_012790 [Reticulibacter mediterranei]
MSSDNKYGSEVAHLLWQISVEYEAAQQGLSGLTQGISQHRFITQRMERMHELHIQVHDLVGEEAMSLIAAHLDQIEQNAANSAPTERETAITRIPET